MFKKGERWRYFFELTAISDEKQFDAFIEMFNSVCCHDPVEKCLKLTESKDRRRESMMSSFFRKKRIVGSYTVYSFHDAVKMVETERDDENSVKPSIFEKKSRMEGLYTVHSLSRKNST